MSRDTRMLPTPKDLAEEMGQRLLTLMRSGDAVAGVDLLDELVDTYGPDVARELFVEGMGVGSRIPGHVVTSADVSPQRLVDEEALREVCEAALYWSATPTTIAAVRKLLPDQVEDLLNDL